MAAPSMIVEISDDLDLTVRGRRAVMTAGNAAAAGVWESKLLGRHFKTGAPTLYGYARRKASTVAIKKRKAAKGRALFGGRRPLVEGGDLMRAMARRHVIRATPKQATIDLHGPKYFNIRYKPGRPNLGEEVLRVAASELPAIGQASQAAADQELTKNRRVRKKVIR